MSFLSFIKGAYHSITHPRSTARKAYHDVKHVIHEAISHPVITAEIAAAPFTHGASLLLTAPTEVVLHHHNSAILDVTSAVGAGTAEGQKWIHTVVDPINKVVTQATTGITSIIKPVTDEIHSVTSLVQSVNDHLIQPIASDIHAVLNAQSAIQQAEHDDLHHGILGMLRFASDVSNSLTSADSVLARSNAQLGEDQRIVATDVMAPAIEDAGSVPSIMRTYHESYQRLVQSTPTPDYPHVDIESPAELPDLKAMLNTAAEFVLHPEKLKRELLARNREVLHTYLGRLTDTAKDYGAELDALFSEGLDELVPWLSVLGTAIFDASMAGKAIDIKYAQQAALWEQDLRAQTPTELLDLGTLITAQRRGIVTEQERIDQGLKTGLDRSRQKVLYELTTWLIPSSLAIQWHARGYIDAATMTTILEWNNVSEADQGNLVDSTYALANPREWIALHERDEFARANFFPESLGTEIPEAIAAQYGRLQIEPFQGQLDWTAHWKFPPVAWWIKAYFRGIRTYTELTAAARMENIPPDVLGDLVGVEQETIQQWMLPDVIAAGVVTDAEFTDYARFIGMEPRSAALLLAWGKTKLKQPLAAAYADLAKVTLGTATTLYEAGSVDRATLLGVFRAHGYSAEAADLAAEGVDLKAEAKDRAAALDTLAAEVDLGRRTLESALSEAYKDQYTAVEIERLESKVRTKKLAKAKLPSESQLHKMLTDSLLTTPQYVAGLELIGYAPAWAQLIAASELGLTLEELEAQL